MNSRITYIKAFTDNPERGNPVAVVSTDDVNSQEAMELVADAKCSVAAVIDTSQGVLIPTRFFYENGKSETHACGHATLGAAMVAFGKNGVGSRIFSTMRLDQAGNRIPSSVQVARGLDMYTQSQPLPEMGEILSPADVSSVIGLGVNDILANDIPVQLVGIPGKQKLLVPVSYSTLMGLVDADIDRRDFCEVIGATGIFPFATDIEFADAIARHFPNTEIEDPVCGVGGVALGSYLASFYEPKDFYRISCGPGSEGVGEMVVKVGSQNTKLSGKACEYRP